MALDDLFSVFDSRTSLLSHLLSATLHPNNLSRSLAVITGFFFLVGWLFHSLRSLFLALAGTALFTVFLLTYLPEKAYVPKFVDEQISLATAKNLESLKSQYDLQEFGVYFPLAVDAEGRCQPVKLFIPKQRNYKLPTRDLENLLCVNTSSYQDQGLLLTPTGFGLLQETRGTLREGLSQNPMVLLNQLEEIMVEELELVNSLNFVFDQPNSRVLIDPSVKEWKAINRIDNPVISFLGCGLALGLSRPVEVHYDRGPDSGSGGENTSEIETNLLTKTEPDSPQYRARSLPQGEGEDFVW
jgi:hypothetical protein